MSQSDYYLEQVERRKHEDKEGRGPYDEAKVDEILWNQALAGDFISVP